jgi:hypothetical protein
MSIEITRLQDVRDPYSLLLRVTGLALEQGLVKAIDGELGAAIVGFVHNDEKLRAQIQQKIDEAFSGINIAAIVTSVVTEIAVGAAKYAMEKTGKELLNPAVVVTTPRGTSAK